MNLVGTILLVTLSVLWLEQDDFKKEISYTVALEKTDCAPTRRLRCSYDFVEVSPRREGKDKRHFNIVFYLGANQEEGKEAGRKEDAISRLDRLFNIKREVSSTSGLADTGTVGYTKPVTLRIEGSKYQFAREDGEEIVVDIEKKTRP
jgi:hypothetical protein